MAHADALPKVHRYITTHNDDGKAIFSSALPDESTMVALGENMGFALSYITTTFPVDLANDTDISAYKPYLSSPPGLTLSSGTVLRHVDFPPSNTPLMHRTVSLDYGVVLEGEMELILDSGEKKVMKRGDVAIQRGTMHAWRNTSDTEWARMMFVLQPCVPLEINGKKLGEELGQAAEAGIKKSD